MSKTDLINNKGQVFTTFQKAVIALICTALLISIALLTLFVERKYSQQGFEEDAQALHQSISHIVSASEGVIITFAGFHQTDEQLDRYELATITQQLFETYPFISQIIKFQVVYPEERIDFEKQMAAAGHYNFQIKQFNNTSNRLEIRHQANQYAPVVQVEPNDPLLSRFIGVDLYSHDSFTMTLRDAIDENTAALMTRPQNWDEEAALSVLRPTYFGHYVPTNRAERWNQLEGGFIAVMQMDEVLKPTIKSGEFTSVGVELTSPENRPLENEPVYQYRDSRPSSSVDFALFAPFKWHSSLQLGERSLVVSVERKYVLSGTQISVLFVSVTTALLLMLTLIRAWTTRRHAEIEESRAKQAAYLERERAEVTLQSIGDAVITTDQDQRIVYMNPVAELMTGSLLPTARDMPLDEIVMLYKEGSGKAVSISHAPFGRDANHDIDYQLRRKDGSSIAVKVSLSQLRNTASEVIGNVMVLHDISTVRELTNQLSHQATHDPLTGIANRRYFEEKLSRLLMESKKNGSVHSLCYIDLDQFKLVNDTCGHSAGDELLKQLTALFKQLARDRDLLARLGGDEFGLLLEHCDVALANDLAQRVRTALRDFYFHYQSKVFNVRASIGVVEISRRSGEIADVLSAADIACYSAKDAGRDEIHIYNPSDQNTISRRGEMHWLQHIQSALTDDKFILFLQPIVALANNMRQTRYEFLVRMVNDAGELISPGQFIPAAERYGLMKDIDHWVIERAIKIIGRDKSNQSKNNVPTLFSINLSGQSISNLEIIDHISQALHKYQVDPGCVCFEITETAAIANLSTAVELINTLREIGCAISLDDFGSGLSSFGYLKRLPIDYLKIDGQFVKGIVDNQFDQAMVQSMVDIGKVLNVKTVGELVENPDIADKLKELGVDFAQGYLYGYPRRASQVLGLSGATDSPHLKLVGH